MAELAAQYLHKGSKIFVAGEMAQASAYLDKDGNPQAYLEVTARIIKFLDKKADTQVLTESTKEPPLVEATLA